MTNKKETHDLYKLISKGMNDWHDGMIKLECDRIGMT